MCLAQPVARNRGDVLVECAKNVETTIQTSTHGKIAAFIAEPVMGVGGFIAPEKDYFDTVAKIVHKYGGKYISDEVQTGAGRCGGCTATSFPRPRARRFPPGCPSSRWTACGPTRAAS